MHGSPRYYSYGYTSPPPGNDSISLLSQNLLLSAQAQALNSGCVSSPGSCANPPPFAPVCNDLNQSPPNIYQSKFDIISTFNPYTWPTSTSNSVLPTNSFCTSGAFCNCCVRIWAISIFLRSEHVSQRRPRLTHVSITFTLTDFRMLQSALLERGKAGRNHPPSTD